jgi:hypothetical protein
VFLLVFPPANLVIELLDWGLRFLGVSLTLSTLVCSLVTIGFAVGVCEFLRRQMYGGDIANQTYSLFLVYGVAGNLLVITIGDNMVLLTQTLFVAFSLFATPIGLTNEHWPQARWIGWGFLVGLSPLVIIAGNLFPEELTHWGPTLVGLSYMVFGFVLAARYVNFRMLCSVVYLAATGRRFPTPE